MDSPLNPGDLTPESGSATDVSPLGQPSPKPAPGPADWNAIAATDEFKNLLRAKARFIVPAVIFFVVYYFALPILVGFCPDFMKTKVGPANIAYLFALSQFFMAWIIAILYSRVAAKWDRQAADLLAKTKHS